MVLDIPLKSSPRVSVVPSFEHPGRVPGRSRNHVNTNDQNMPLTRVSSGLNKGPEKSRDKSYKLTRTYSESETNNFDADTGHRLFDDGRIRSKPSRTASPIRPEISSRESSGSDLRARSYSQSHSALIDCDTMSFAGLEDEYIPGLDFADVVQHWNRPLADNSGTNSREASYLDLNQLHAKVAPKPIRASSRAFKKDNTTFALGSDSSEDPIRKKFKGSPNPSNQASYESILANLPTNFNDLPYSQRKKLVKDFSASIDYSQFSQFAKNYFHPNSGSDGRSFVSDSGRNGSFVRRSRRNSANTIAGRLLALSSSSENNKTENSTKTNVDEKGAFVFDHQLGKIIGFGAWGIIRECIAKDGSVKAVKIVKSSKELERSDTPHSPRILQRFRKEIQIWQKLHHPNILPLLDSLETETATFCLTNRIGGGTLFDLVSRWGIFDEGIDSTSGPIGFDVERQRTRLFQTIIYAAQIAEALTYMHQELGIVHGDLKLENILVDDSSPKHRKMILCDFGMSRVFNQRASRTQSKEDASAVRSRSSFASVRRPYNGPDTIDTRHLFSDDSKIGISHLFHQSQQLSPDTSKGSAGSRLSDFHEFKSKERLISEMNSDVPHSHIGSLPYASPELLSPSPPPLGPSADVWAFGVLLYTMAVGRLPFQHSYEPRLRAVIASGKFNKKELRQAALVDNVIEEAVDTTSSLIDMSRKSELESIKAELKSHDASEFQWVSELVEGCLEKDITKRWELSKVFAALVHQ